MIARRRLSMQLTPLLDLLLIVMFSQYIENRQKTQVAQEQLVAERASIQTELDQRRAELEQEFAESRKTVDQLRQTLDERFRSIIDQHHQVGSLLAESLNLPGASMAEVLKLRTAGSPEDAARLSAATDRLQELMTARGEEVFRFLVKVDEMQKHVSVWKLMCRTTDRLAYRTAIKRLPLTLDPKRIFLPGSSKPVSLLQIQKHW